MAILYQIEISTGATLVAEGAHQGVVTLRIPGALSPVTIPANYLADASEAWSRLTTTTTWPPSCRSSSFQRARLRQ
jgi:hypothetical protein